MNSFPLQSEASFSALDISPDNKLLFRLNYYSGASEGEALFVTDIAAQSIQQLTIVPERMDLLDNGRILQIRNAQGTIRIPAKGGLPEQAALRPEALLGADAGSLPARAEETAVSPNGRWLLTLEPETHAYGTLVLVDALTGAGITIAAGIERQDRAFPASWSPDSRFFVYARLGKLYYCPVNSSVSPVDEKFRLIGEGTVNSIVWERDGDFFYLKGSTVYRVRGMELFARTLYADFLDIGIIAGKIPFEFNPAFDKFWIAPDAGSLLLLTGGRTVFYYPLENDDYHTRKPGFPYLVLPRSAFDVKTFWPLTGGITVMARVPGKAPLVFRFDREAGVFSPLASPQGDFWSLSPDGKMLLSWGSAGTVLYDYERWTVLETISPRPAYSCLWSGGNELIMGNDQSIEKIILLPGGNGKILGRELICLSGAASFGFEAAPGSSRILARNGDDWFVTDGKLPWMQITNPRTRPASQSSGLYRVYLETRHSGLFENLPMIRGAASVGTFPLVTLSGSAASPPIKTSPKELGLCFDLYDDAEGLPEVLDALAAFGVKATFFLGGEFIRRYPGAARDIAASGHEAASLFFAPIDFSDPRYQLDGEFISRGLARNEDEYFNATGSELALLWHPPWYASPPLAALAAKEAGYITVDRDVDPLDWIGENEAAGGLPRYSAAEMVDRVVNMAAPGAIIPVRLGLLPGGRNDYLFRKVGVLLAALASEGYTVVPVSRLVPRAPVPAP